MAKKKPVTAAELVAALNADHKFVEQRAKEESARAARVAAWQEAEGPLVEALRAAGFEVDSAWDLLERGRPYEDALPILARHLQRPYPSRVREGIARALAVAPSIEYWDTLYRLYGDEQARDAKAGLAVALSAAADESVLDDLVALVRDRSHGSSRVLLLSALERIGNLVARATLKELQSDPLLGGEAEAIMRRVGQRYGQTLGAARDRREGRTVSMSELHEASMNFDLETVAPFLERMRHRVPSLSEGDVRGLVGEVNGLAVGEEAEVMLEVSYGGETVPFKVTIRMSDSGAPDISFFTSLALAKVVEEELEAFADELGN